MRGNGRVFLRGQIYWIAYCLNGKEYRESAKTDNEKKAAAYLKHRIKEVGADQLGLQNFVTPQASRLTVAELCEAVKRDFELRGKASAPNLCQLRRVEADFGRRRASELTSEYIDEYIEQRLANGDAKASINRITQLLRQCYALAVRRGHLSRAPHIRHLSERGNERQGFLTPAEFRSVLAHLPDDLKDFAAWAYATAMRKGEASKLTWDMVEGDELRIPGDITKNKKARTIPLVGELAEIIERRKALRSLAEGSTVCIARNIFHRGGEPVQEFRKPWSRACKVAGVGGTRFHDLRRSAARNLSQAGVPREIAKKITGHITDAMWQRYNIVVTDDMRHALEQTERYRAAAQQRVVSIAQR